jgi:hypothetical protein
MEIWNVQINAQLGGLKSNVMARAMLQKKTMNKNHRKTEKLLYE